jgi:hypothetical protein
MSLVERRAGGLLVGADPFFIIFRDKLVALAAGHRVPTIYGYRDFMAVGGLVSYGTDLAAAYHQIGAYTGRSSSPGDLEPVFQAMLTNATRICEANFGVLFLCEDGAFRTVALHNAPAAFAEERRRNPVLRPHPGTGLGRVAATKQPVQIADAQAVRAAGEFRRIDGPRRVVSRDEVRRLNSYVSQRDT